ncbi:helix-turn-helix domain-containing protein [Hoeflea sp. TYP-13]|uniref:helix-turn-helix domain-containing protein n=1 Tax=Hoeflea sp. TYP-13 TaxID=3230023 RepID=UPI0034C670E6
MRLKEWRLTQKLTLADCAAALGCNGARTYQRYEDGMHRTDALFVEAIVELTDGAVTAQDMHETRLEWLKANGRGEPAHV